MNLDMIAEDSEEYINRMYKVFHDKKHILKASRRKSNSGRSKSLIPIMLPKGETGAKSHRSMSNMEMRSSVSRIARSNSEEEASFMLKVLNYPEIYYKNAACSSRKAGQPDPTVEEEDGIDFKCFTG